MQLTRATLAIAIAATASALPVTDKQPVPLPVEQVLPGHVQDANCPGCGQGDGAKVPRSDSQLYYAQGKPSSMSDAMHKDMEPRSTEFCMASENKAGCIPDRVSRDLKKEPRSHQALAQGKPGNTHTDAMQKEPRSHQALAQGKPGNMHTDAMQKEPRSKFDFSNDFQGKPSSVSEAMHKEPRWLWTHESQAKPETQMPTDTLWDSGRSGSDDSKFERRSYFPLAVEGKPGYNGHSMYTMSQGSRDRSQTLYVPGHDGSHGMTEEEWKSHGVTEEQWKGMPTQEWSSPSTKQQWTSQTKGGQVEQWTIPHGGLTERDERWVPGADGRWTMSSGGMRNLNAMSGRKDGYDSQAEFSGQKHGFEGLMVTLSSGRKDGYDAQAEFSGRKDGYDRQAEWSGRKDGYDAALSSMSGRKDGYDAQAEYSGRKDGYDNSFSSGRKDGYDAQAEYSGRKDGYDLSGRKDGYDAPIVARQAISTSDLKKGVAAFPIPPWVGLNNGHSGSVVGGLVEAEKKKGLDSSALWLSDSQRQQGSGTSMTDFESQSLGVVKGSGMDMDAVKGGLVVDEERKGGSPATTVAMVGGDECSTSGCGSQ